MSRYQPLAEFLSARKGDQWEASFTDIEARLGFPLPKSAYRYPAWWANQRGGGHSQTEGWQSVGWRTAGLDLENQRVRFERDARESSSSSAEDDNPLFERAAGLTGISDRGRLIDEALRALIAREASLRLARMGGAMPEYRAPDRERPGA